MYTSQIFFVNWHVLICYVRYEIDFEVIRRKGTIVFVGNASGVVPPISPLRLVNKNIVLVRPTYVRRTPLIVSKLTAMFSLV